MEPVSVPEGQGHRERSCWTGMAGRGGNGDGLSLEEEWGLQCRNCQELQPRNPGMGQSRQSQERLQTLASRVAAPRAGQPSPPLLSPQQTWASMTCLGSWKERLRVATAHRLIWR